MSQLNENAAHSIYLAGGNRDGVGRSFMLVLVFVFFLEPVEPSRAAERLLGPRAAIEARTLQLAKEPYASGERKSGAAGGGRTAVRPLVTFEKNAKDGQPVPQLSRRADNADIVYVQDNGVTEGKWCGRITIPKDAEFGNVILDGELVRDWSSFDYFSMDLYTDETEPLELNFELWDTASKNFATRCTFAQPTHPGHQTLLFQINRAKRNSKEGRSWDELEEKDKIDLASLKMVKLFTAGRKDHPVHLWVDNLRLLQSDAAKPSLQIALPQSTVAAIQFGAATVAGFTAADPAAKSPAGNYSGKGVVSGGTGWPDPIGGTFVRTDHDEMLTYKLSVPNGRYAFWLCAGPILSAQEPPAQLLLQLNDQKLVDEKPDSAAFDGEKFLYRSLWTQYSQRPHAIWLDYIEKMFPTFQGDIEVTDGTLVLTARNHFVSALILVPQSQSADLERAAARLRLARMEAFEKSAYVTEHPSPPHHAADGDYTLYVPPDGQPILPWSAPPQGDRSPAKLSAVTAPGQPVVLRLAMTPFKDLGDCRLVLSDLNGPGGAQISKDAIQGHFLNYRYGREASEMVLLPTLSFRAESGISQSLWLLLRVPSDAKPGRYAGSFSFESTAGKPTAVPVEIEVVNAKVATELPASIGMYYSGRSYPHPPAGTYWDIVREQLVWQRKLGFTATALLADTEVTGVNEQTGKVTLKFDDRGVRVVREAGFGVEPHQRLMTSQLGIARSIGRRLIGPSVDQNPGSELSAPGFANLHRDAMRQYREFLDSLHLPYAVEIVDEPREIPNPWNRNLADTAVYGDWLAEEGFTNRRFLTLMSDDGGGGKSYVGLVDHADILSLHPWALSTKIQRQTLAQHKALWFYNGGMSRYSWGAHPWALRAAGRWEYHWCAPEVDTHPNGYPGEDWYNPYTAMDAYAPNAPPAEFPGGFLYKTALLTAIDGITDWRFFHSLEQEVSRHRNDAVAAPAVRKAKALLEQIRKTIPEFADDPPAVDLNAWRTEAAKLLADLQRG